MDLPKNPDTASPKVAVTGVTGVVGGLVARALAARGIPQRLLARNPSRVPSLPLTTVHQAGYADLFEVRAALNGIDTLFMVSASESADRVDVHRKFIDAAVEAGVGHVVYTSFVGAAPDATFTLARDHHATEEHLKASGIAWTFLRDNFYIDFMEDLVDKDGVIRGPASNGRCAVVTRADVAHTAATVLASPAQHAGRTYNLTGPEALTLSEVAETISKARNRPVRFEHETLAEAYASRAGFAAPSWQVDAWVSTYTAIASGAMETVTGDIEAITGKPPTSLKAYLAEKRGETSEPR